MRLKERNEIDEFCRGFFGITCTDASRRVSRLDPAQLKILELLVTGHEVQDLVRQLGMTLRSVYQRRHEIYTTLGTNATGAGRVWYAAKFGSQQ